MKVKLNTALHFSEFGRDHVPAGDTVDLPDAQAKDLVKRGLASEVASARPKAQGASPRNKAEGRSAANKRR